METVLNNLRAVLCDPEGKCCISGSDADRAIVDEALAILAARDAQWQAALAEQEPAYWIVEWRGKGSSRTVWRTSRPLTSMKDAETARSNLETGYPSVSSSLEYVIVPLYTHPAPTNPAAQERAEPVAPAVLRRWIVAKQVAADTGGPRPELAYQIFESVPAFDSFEDCAAAISEAGLPLGWVAIEADRLNLTPATPPAPAQPSPEPSKPEQAEAAKHLLTEEEHCALDFCGHILYEIEVGRVLRSDESHVKDYRAATITDAKRMAAAARKRINPVFARLTRATLPPASAAGEREELLRGEVDAITELNHAQWLALENVRTLAARHRKEEWAQHMLRWCEEAGNASRTLRAALATKPQAEQEATPPAQTVQDKKGGV